MVIQNCTKFPLRAFFDHEKDTKKACFLTEKVPFCSLKTSTFLGYFLDFCDCYLLSCFWRALGLDFWQKKMESFEVWRLMVKLERPRPRPTLDGAKTLVNTCKYKSRWQQVDLHIWLIRTLCLPKLVSASHLFYLKVMGFQGPFPQLVSWSPDFWLPSTVAFQPLVAQRGQNQTLKGEFPHGTPTVSANFGGWVIKCWKIGIKKEHYQVTTTWWSCKNFAWSDQLNEFKEIRETKKLSYYGFLWSGNSTLASEKGVFYWLNFMLVVNRQGGKGDYASSSNPPRTYPPQK